MPERGVEVLVKFSEGIPLDAQGRALLNMEIELRKSTGLDVRVVKELMGDDSKLRRMLTIKQREAL